MPELALLLAGIQSRDGFDNELYPLLIDYHQEQNSLETYVLDNASNLTSKTVGTTTTSYAYDVADQLLSETAPSYSESFTYDANGNRATAVVGGVSQTYNVDNGDKLNSVTAGGVTIKSYAYDAAGRTTGVATSAGTTTLSYDYEDRITGITYPSLSTNSFTYNGLDTRVSKVDSAGTYAYVRDGADVTDSVLEDGHANYTPGVSRRASSATTFDNLNYIGTSALQTNSSQATTATRTYDAFGNLVASTGTPVGPFGFVGAEGDQADSDSSLMLLGHRYYDPSTGRFLTRDNAKDGRNWYGYCDNGPTNSSDPEGLQAHGNTLGTQPATLYALYDKEGNFIKWGITQWADPNKRYPAMERWGGVAVPLERGPRNQIAKIERDLEETKPGIGNRVPWRGARLGQKPIYNYRIYKNGKVVRTRNDGEGEPVETVGESGTEPLEFGEYEGDPHH